MADITDSGRGSGKSAAAFRTISEVATELDLPQHVLRFWETKFHQVRPLKRGGGRRYYRPEDVALLRRIKALLYDEGYTIRGVQKLLREGNLNKAAVAAEAAAAAEAAIPIKPGIMALSEKQRAELEALLTELTELRNMLRSAEI